MQGQNTHRRPVFLRAEPLGRQQEAHLWVVEERQPLAVQAASLVVEVESLVPSLPAPCPFKVVLCMALDVCKTSGVGVRRSSGSGDDHDGDVPPVGKLAQEADVPSQEKAGLQRRNCIVTVHGQHTVHHDHGRTRDGDFIGQPLKLPIELVKREASAQVQSSKARFDVGSKGLKHRNEAGRIDSACTVHPMHQFPPGQRVADPVLGDASHALSRSPRSTEVVELSRLRLDVHGVNALQASGQRSVSFQWGWRGFHVNHRRSLSGVINPYEHPST